MTAGPGVTNALSAIGSAQSNNSPVLVLGGRAPALRWGRGSLQEIDHVPFVRPLTKLAATPDSTAEIPGLVDEALRAAMTPHSGPTFLDFPMDHVFSEAEEPASDAGAADAASRRRRRRRRDRARRGAAGARPSGRSMMAGTNLYWGHGEAALRALGRGAAASRSSSTAWRAAACRPTTSCSSRARAAPALTGADVALVIGVPMDFRLGFGESFGPETEIVVIDVAEPQREHPRAVAAELYGALPATLDALRDVAARRAARHARVVGRAAARRRGRRSTRPRRRS